MQMPSDVRPHRPLRWSAEARETGSIGSRCTLVRWLYREIRAVPGSITYLMPGTVSEVSATLVASTTRGRWCGWKTRCCSAADSRAYSGSTSTSPGSSASASAVSLISRSPLRKTRTSPGPSARNSASASQIPCTWSFGSSAGRSGSASGQEPPQVAEDEVDVQAALVGLVDDQGVVAPQLPVPLQLGQQDPVGHHLDLCAVAGLVGEPDLVTDGRTEFGAQFLGDAFGHGTRRDPAGLGVADLAARAAAELQADLRQLSGLARAGLASDDDNLMVADGRGDLVLPLADRQFRRIGDLQRGDQGGSLHGRHGEHR